MVRVGGLRLRVRAGGEDRQPHLGSSPSAASRSTPARRYKVAGWASVQENPAGRADLGRGRAYLRDRRVVPLQRLNVPRLEGVAGNPGLG